MKLICLIILTIFSIIVMSSPKNNDLANTSWIGIINAPDAIEAKLKFSEDTLYVYADTQLIETSLYAVSSDTIRIEKISGVSPCKDEIGIYTFQVNNNVLIIKPITDICESRFNVFSPLGYEGKN